MIIFRYLFYEDAASIHINVWLRLSYHAVSKRYCFLCITLCISAGLSQQCFVDDHRCFLLLELIQQLILQFAPYGDVGLPKRRFDVHFHTTNPRAGEILYLHLTIFQQMCTVNQGYHFLCLLWRFIFPRGSTGSIFTMFYWWLLLILFTNFVSRIVIYVCTCNIIILLPILLSVLKISLLFSTDSVIYLIYLNELSTSRLNKLIFSLRFSTKIWFPLLRKLL